MADAALLPPSLRIMNPKAWGQLATHLKSRPHVPVMLHGPTGCGKTHGTEELLNALQMRAVCLDAVEADNTQQLVTWVRRTREAHTLKRQSVIVLDDLEGFTANARAELAKLSKDERSGLNPLIFICNERRSPMWKDFSKKMGDVRLFAPNVHTVLKWFATCYVWTSVHDQTTRQGVSETVLRTHCDALLHHGDLRRIVTALETQQRLGANLSLHHDQHVTNTFDASRRLLKGTMTPAAWASMTEPRDVALLQYHVPNYATDIHELSRCLDTFATCDAMMPDRFELCNAQHGLTHITQASAVQQQLPTRSRDVGALCLPPRIVCNRPRPEEDSQWKRRLEAAHA